MGRTGAHIAAARRGRPTPPFSLAGRVLVARRLHSFCGAGHGPASRFPAWGAGPLSSPDSSNYWPGVLTPGHFRVRRGPAVSPDRRRNDQTMIGMLVLCFFLGALSGGVWPAVGYGLVGALIGVPGGFVVNLSRRLFGEPHRGPRDIAIVVLATAVSWLLL